MEIETQINLGQWYSVQVMPGHENKVKTHLENRGKLIGDKGNLHKVVVPTERVEEVKRGSRRTSNRKLFPGYIFVNIDLYNENNELIEEPWYLVKDTPGVKGFVGGDKPIRMSNDEITGLLKYLQSIENKILPKTVYAIGDTLSITDGPFKGLTGVVEKTETDSSKITVSVNIFGRSTMVDLELWQVSKD